MSKAVSKEEIQTIKLLLSKGLTRKQICWVTGRSHATVDRVANGQFDERLKSPVKKTSNDDLHSLILKTFDLLAEIEEKIK